MTKSGIGGGASPALRLLPKGAKNSRGSTELTEIWSLVVSFFAAHSHSRHVRPLRNPAIVMAGLSDKEVRKCEGWEK